MDCGFGADWDCLWRAGCHGAAEHEEADRVFLDQPPGICRARHIQLYASWAEWRNVRHARARCFNWRSVHARRNPLRTSAHVRDLRVRRPGYANAQVRDILPGDFAGFGWIASAEWIHRRIFGFERSLPGKDVVGHRWCYRSDLERMLPVVDVSARVLWSGK